MPSNGLDLNTIDYKIWGVMQQRVYETQIHNVDGLKQWLVDVWSGLQQSVVDAAVFLSYLQGDVTIYAEASDAAVSQWRKHLQAYVCTKTGYFEYLL